MQIQTPMLPAVQATKQDSTGVLKSWMLAEVTMAQELVHKDVA